MTDLSKSLPIVEDHLSVASNPGSVKSDEMLSKPAHRVHLFWMSAVCLVWISSPSLGSRMRLWNPRKDLWRALGIVLIFLYELDVPGPCWARL